MAIQYLYTVDTSKPRPEVKDTNFAKYYPGVNDATKWEMLRSYVEQAVEIYIKPYVGLEYYEWLLTNEVAQTPDAEGVYIANILKQATARFAINLAAPEHMAIIGDAGLRQGTSDGANPMSQWAYRSLRWNLVLQAHKLLDIALDKLGETLPELYKNSNAYTDYSSDFFANRKEYAKYVSSTGVRSWVAMQPYIKKAEQELSDKLCAQYDDLLTKTNPTESEAKLIELCKQYVAERSVYESLPYLMIYLDGHNVVVLTSADGVEQGYGVYNAANIDKVNMLLKASKDNADKAMGRIVNYLNVHQDDFPVHLERLEAGRYHQKTVYSSPDCVGGVII